MVKIDKEIIINAPLEKIFDYVSKPSNLPQIWPSLVEIKNEQLLPNGGYSAEWLYKMGGIFLEGTGKYNGIVPNQWFTIETKGAVDSTLMWTFWPCGEQTRVTLTIDYRVPIPVLGHLAEMIIIKMNENQADLILANLRVIMEGS
jgi:uncharacterized protein YndB with AHSA1/START domain